MTRIAGRGSPPLDNRRGEIYRLGVGETAEPLTVPDQEKETRTRDDLDPGYLVVCWNDPVNLMDYVTHVFQKVFGWDRQKAEVHMLEVHNQGRSVLAREGLEKAEFFVLSSRATPCMRRWSGTNENDVRQQRR